MNFRPEPQDGFSLAERDFHEMANEFARMDAEAFEREIEEINLKLSVVDEPDWFVDEAEMSFLPLV